MKCPHCTGEINVSQDAHVIEAAHDEQKLDIVHMPAMFKCVQCVCRY